MSEDEEVVSPHWMVALHSPAPTAAAAAIVGKRRRLRLLVTAIVPCLPDAPSRSKERLEGERERQRAQLRTETRGRRYDKEQL